MDPTRSTGLRDSLLIEKVSLFSSFEKSVPSEEQLCLESPLTFYFYLLRGKSSKNKKPLINSSQEKAVHENWIFGFED